MAKKKTVTKTLSVDELVLDGGTQSRVSIDEDTVDRYVEVLESQTSRKWPFPNLVVFHDGNQYLVASGFHRTLAALRHGRASAPCDIEQGTAWDALLYGMGANQKHGLPPSHADNRRSIEILLDSNKTMSQKEISEIVGVSTRTVRRVVAARKEESNTDDPFSVGDPFGEGEDDDTEADDHDEEGQQEPPPGSPGEGKDDPGDSPPNPAELFKTQRSKTVKTMEAAMRAFDDLNDLRKRKTDHSAAITACKKLLDTARNW